MRIKWKHLIMALVLLPLVGLGLGWSGLIDTRASSGHWRATDWFLHWVMRSSVRTAALGMEVPDLDDPALVPAAAGHFEIACATCHGSPAEPRSPVSLSMLPVPPDLDEVVDSWTDAQLFQIVKHGVRFTGMPAWPTLKRDDEVWQMVAFLRRLPELGADEYRSLSGAPALASHLQLPQAIAFCTACHLDDTTQDATLAPVLAGQNRAYLLASLHAYRDGARPSGIMQTAISGMDDAMLEALAGHFAGLSDSGRGLQQADAASGAGPVETLVETGNAARQIPACLSCHGENDNPAYPVLWGQRPAYLAGQLRLFAEGARGGTDRHHLMTEAGKHLEEADIEALARYFAGRPVKP